MKTKIQFLGLNAHPGWNGLAKQQLKHLEGLIPITAAKVVMEHWREITPAFHVRVLLEVSGPDLHAEAFDHTLEAALLKATQDLEHQVQARQLRRIERGRSKLQLSATSSRWPMPGPVKELEGEECATAGGPYKKPKGSKRMKQKRLLLVDNDNESLLRSLRHSLSSETHEVVLAKSLQQAIANSQASEIDPFSMNLDSPTEDEGWEAMEAMEQSRKRIRSCKELAEATEDRAVVEQPVDGPMLLQTIRESLEEPDQSPMRRAYNQEIDFRHVPPGNGDFLDLLDRRYAAPSRFPLPHSRWGINE